MEPKVRLKELRESRRVTQAELARRLGVDRSYVSRIEHGQRLPGLTMLAQLARYFGCRLEELVIMDADGHSRR